jgi:fermentation-respiration switch protein FrsA (DUF1100 family)
VKLLRRIGIALAVGIVAAYLVVLAGMYVFQRDLQYDRSGSLIELAETALTTAELVTIPNEDGSSVTGWYAPPEAGMPAILYFRGNSQSFSREHERFATFVGEGYGFLAFDYRGFPGSPGETSEANILADAMSAYDWLAEKQDPILIWGRSLGSGPATYVAKEREAEALFLETPFDSAVAVAADRYGFLPVGLLMLDQFRVDEWIDEVDEPVFVAHGTADRTIGFAHGQRVYELAPIKAGFWVVDGAGHAELWERGLWTEAKAFFEGVGGAK